MQSEKTDIYVVMLCKKRMNQINIAVCMCVVKRLILMIE